MPPGAEASRIAGLAQQASRGNGTDAGDCLQRFVAVSEARSDSTPELGDLGGQLLETTESSQGDLRRWPVQGRKQLSRLAPIRGACQTTESIG
jgi:hypothetical protein